MLLFVTILQLIAALLLILIVLFQSGKSQGLSGAIGGIADSYQEQGPFSGRQAGQGYQVAGRCVCCADAGSQLHDRRWQVSIICIIKTSDVKASEVFFVYLIP